MRREKFTAREDLTKINKTKRKKYSAKHTDMTDYHQLNCLSCDYVNHKKISQKSVEIRSFLYSGCLFQRQFTKMDDTKS
jgi:hypothetical protein